MMYINQDDNGDPTSCLDKEDHHDHDDDHHHHKECDSRLRRPSCTDQATPERKVTFVRSVKVRVIPALVEKRERGRRGGGQEKEEPRDEDKDSIWYSKKEIIKMRDEHLSVVRCAGLFGPSDRELMKSIYGIDSVESREARKERIRECRVAVLQMQERLWTENEHEETDVELLALRSQVFSIEASHEARTRGANIARLVLLETTKSMFPSSCRWKDCSSFVTDDIATKPPFKLERMVLKFRGSRRTTRKAGHPKSSAPIGAS